MIGSHPDASPPPVPHGGRHFEDFAVGDVYRHARGKTVTEMDGVLIANMVMNTAEAHFNADARKDSAFPHVLVFGGVTISLVIGLATQDTAENAVAELGLDGIRLRAPVTHGDTLYAYTEVLDKEDSRGDSSGDSGGDGAGSGTGSGSGTDGGTEPGAGVVTFRHWGVNQDGVVVFEGRRRTLIRRAGAER